MKKSVAVILVLALIALVLLINDGRNTYTGLQVADLPPPPAPPGALADQEVPEPPEPEMPPEEEELDLPEETADAEAILETIRETEVIEERIDSVETRLEALDLLPGWEQRLNEVEQKVALASDVPERLNSLESKVNGMAVDISNLQKATDRPYVEYPAFLDELQNMGKRNTVLTISLFVLALLIVIGLVATLIIQRKKENMENRQLIRQYLINYQKAGYRLETLRMHLRASGWKDSIIDEAIKELPK